MGLGKGYDAENAFACFEGSVQVGLFVERFNIDRALLGGDLKFAAVLNAAANVGAQAFFKHVTVESFEHQLSEFQ